MYFTQRIIEGKSMKFQHDMTLKTQFKEVKDCLDVSKMAC